MLQEIVNVFGSNLRKAIAAVVRQSIVGGIADGLQEAKGQLTLQVDVQDVQPVTLEPLTLDAPAARVVAVSPAKPTRKRR